MAEEYNRDNTRKLLMSCLKTRTFGDPALRPDDYFEIEFEHTNSDHLYGFKNPHWQSMVSQHRNATTNMSARRERLNIKPMERMEILHWTPSPPWHGLTTAHCIGKPQGYPNAASYSVSSSLEDEANNQALMRVVAQMRRAQTSVQGGTVLGELGQAIRMLKRPTQRLRAGLDDYLSSVKKQGTRRSVSRLPRNQRRRVRNTIVSDLWLEYSFGWRPFVNDALDAIDAIKNRDLYNSIEIHNVYGRGEAEERRAIVPDLNPYGMTPSMKYDVKHIHKVIVVYKGQMGNGPSAAGYAARRVGLDTSSFLPTVWELVPYSFLADYFTNIGEIISAASLNTSGLKWLKKTVITERLAEAVNQQQLDYLADSGSSGGATWTNQRVTISPGAASHSIREVVRSPYSGSLVPNLDFSIPGMGTKWINMTALFNNAYQLQRSFRS